MKTNQSITIAILFISTLTFSSCSKNISSSTANAPSTESVSALTDAAGTTTLVLRPGPKQGQDAYIQYTANDPNSVNGNFNNIPELPVLAWTNGGALVETRTYIKFDSLVKIPTTAKVISATLQFFGLQGSSITTLQGNSVYPGSPYGAYPDNEVLVQRVAGAWDASTLTWANQPVITEVNEDTIATSTAQWDYNPQINVTKLVRIMVAHPTKNFGFKLTLADEAIYRSMVFASCEASKVALRPKLTVVYQ